MVITLPKFTKFQNRWSLLAKVHSVEVLHRLKCDSPYFVVEDKYLLSSDRKKLIFYFGQERVIKIPDGIETIGSSSFCSRDFDTFIIPSSVRRIEDNPFINSVSVVDSLGKPRCITHRIISHSEQFIVRDCMLIDTAKR